MPHPTPPIIRTTAKQPSPIPGPSRFTIDTILSVLSKSIFNPFIAWVLVLCLRAQVTPQTDPAWILTVTYASVLTALFITRTINHRLAYGQPRTVDDEVVLVTGGASGLGLLIAQNYAMRGASVAVLDIKGVDKDASEGSGTILHIACDVAEREALEKARQRIEEEVCLLFVLLICRLPYDGLFRDLLLIISCIL